MPDRFAYLWFFKFRIESSADFLKIEKDNAFSLKVLNPFGFGDGQPHHACDQNRDATSY